MKKPSPYNPSNLLSLLRITLVPVFIVCLQYGQDAWALAAFAVASLTDFFDGWLARRYGWTTKLGEFIDPLGDKLLTLSALVMLHLQGRLPFWAPVAGFMRELVVVTGYVLLAVVARQTALKVSLAGKAGTLMQMVFLSLVLGARPLDFSPFWESFAVYGLLASVALNFLSGLDYAARGIHDYEKHKHEKGR